MQLHIVFSIPSAEKIAFTASLASTLSDHHQKPVIYSTVQTNIGSGYSATTGVFTAPMAGTYVFVWHGVIHKSSYCELNLYKNGNGLQFWAVADSRGVADATDSGSNSAVLTLNTGDTVGIRTVTCGYLYPLPFTTFSGFKIWSHLLL